MKRLFRKLKICLRVLKSPIEEYRTEVTMDLFDACNFAYVRLRNSDQKDVALVLGRAMSDMARGFP